MSEFRPLFRNPHVQTILSHFWRRPASRDRFPMTSRLYRTEPDVQVLVTSQQPAGKARGHLVMVHGLEGSGEAGYIQSLSAAALGHGYGAHAFHMRTCGGTEGLCQTLYHAGLTSDLLAVIREFAREGRGPVYLAGFSLGGNVALKLAGELGDDAAGLIRSVVAASTPLDLAACAHQLSAPENRVYERRFLRRMRARLCATGRYRPADFAGIRTILEIDDRITAPSFGFGTAANYYRTQSSISFVPKIRIPVLLIQSQDDTLVPFRVFQSDEVRGNPCVQLLATEHGGHLGFLGRRPRFWLDQAILEWIGSR
jgi:predicted alpha/beta-fold hydrolase